MVNLPPGNGTEDTGGLGAVGWMGLGGGAAGKGMEPGTAAVLCSSIPGMGMVLEGGVGGKGTLRPNGGIPGAGIPSAVPGGLTGLGIAGGPGMVDGDLNAIGWEGETGPSLRRVGSGAAGVGWMAGLAGGCFDAGLLLGMGASGKLTSTKAGEPETKCLGAEKTLSIPVGRFTRF